MKYKLRPYQEKCDQIIFDKLDKGISSQLIVEATGCGKRFQAVHSARNFKNVLFLAHTEELIEQAAEEFDKYYPMNVGIVKGPRFEIDKKIVIASAQTIWRRLDRIPSDYFDYIIADEVHHYLAKSFVLPLRHFKPRLITGWTATPKRLDGLSFSGIFDEIVFDYSIDKAIPDMYLANLEARRIKTAIDITGVKRTAGDFNQKELSMKVDIPSRNKLIVEKYLQYSRNMQGVVYCVDIEHAINIQKEFVHKGINCRAIHSGLNDDERRMINKGFKAGEIKVLTNVQILTEGWDYSDIGIIMMARPTQSIALYCQIIGRGTRLKSLEFLRAHYKKDYYSIVNEFREHIRKDKITYNEKGLTFLKHYSQEEDITVDEVNFIKKMHSINKCIVLDFVDNSKQNTLVNCWSLEEKKPIEAKLFLPKEQKEKLLEEKKRREIKIKTLTRNDTRINLLALPKIYISSSPKMREPATEKQIQYMQRLGVWVEGNEYTKGQASELISSCSASPTQIAALHRLGYDISNGVTVGEAQLAFEEFNKAKEDAGFTKPTPVKF